MKWIRSTRYQAETLLAKFTILGIRFLPMTWAWYLGRGTGWVCYYLLRKRRAVVEQNLQIVMTAMHESAHNKIRGDAAAVHPPANCAREVFMRTGANLFCGFVFAKFSSDQITKHIDIEGADVLRDALKENNGAIILAAHMGPWEALGQLPKVMPQYGLEAPIGSLYRRLNNPLLDRWYRKYRRSAGATLFESRHSFHPPIEFLKSGGILCLLADQRMSGGKQVRYFGRLTRSTPLPGILHLRSQAPMLALTLVTTGRCRWRLSLRRIDDSDSISYKDRAQHTQLVADAMAHTLSQSLADGFWFHNRFKGSEPLTVQ